MPVEYVNPANGLYFVCPSCLKVCFLGLDKFDKKRNGRAVKSPYEYDVACTGCKKPAVYWRRLGGRFRPTAAAAGPARGSDGA